MKIKDLVPFDIFWWKSFDFLRMFVIMFNNFILWTNELIDTIITISVNNIRYNCNELKKNKQNYPSINNTF